MTASRPIRLFFTALIAANTALFGLQTPGFAADTADMLPAKEIVVQEESETPAPAPEAVTQEVLEPAEAEPAPAEDSASPLSDAPEPVQEEEAAPAESSAQEPAAEEALPQDETATPLNPQDVDFDALESAGLVSKANEGGLETDLWQGSQRSAITALLKNMPAVAVSPAVQKLIISALLTSANIHVLDNDVPIKPGSDLLTLRLRKLVEAGAYRKAFELYAKPGSEPYHENLAEAGILAMMFSGEKSLACIEVNTVRSRFLDAAFIQNIAAYCDATISEGEEEGSLSLLRKSGLPILSKLAGDKNYTYAYTPEKFSSLSLQEQAALAAEDRLDISQADIKAIPAKHASFLMNSARLTYEQRILLTAKAVEHGFEDIKTLKNLYKPPKPASGDTTPPQTLPADFAEIAAAFSDETDEHWLAVLKALRLVNTLGPAVFIPFADSLAKENPVQVNTSQVIQAFRIFRAAGLAVPDSWAKILEGIQPQDIDADTYCRLLATAYSQKNPDHLSDNQKSVISQSFNASKKETQDSLFGIIENIDKSLAVVNNGVNAYENELNLTFGRDYVMPSVRVWDRLTIASQGKAAGETVLLGTSLLSGEALQSAYPGLLRDVLHSFNKMGLTDIADELAATASIGDTQ